MKGGGPRATAHQYTFTDWLVIVAIVIVALLASIMVLELVCLGITTNYLK